MFRSSLFYLLGRYGGSAITLMGIAGATRLVEPGDYGLYALALSASTFLYSSLLYWIRDSLLRFMPRHTEDEGRLLSQFAIGYCAVALACIVVAALSPLFDLGVQSRRLVAFIALLFLSLALCEICFALLQSRMQAGRYARLSLWRAMIGAGLSLGLAWAGWGATGLVIGMAAGSLATALPVLVEVRGLLSLRRFEPALLKEILSYGLGFSAIAALIAFNAVSDRYIIGWLIGSEAAGLYAAPYDLTARSLQVLMLAVNLAGTPLIFRAFDAGGAAQARPLLRRQFTLLVGVGLPAALGMSILARFTTTLLLGPAFQATGRDLMPWIAFATVMQSLELFYFSFAFSLTRRPLGQFLILVPTAVVNVALNILLIPRFGLTGAAAATVISYAGSLVGMALVGRRMLALPLPLADLGRIALACAAMAAVLWPVRDWTGLPAAAVALGLAAPVYLAIVVALDVAGMRSALFEVLGSLRRRLRRPRVAPSPQEP